MIGFILIAISGSLIILLCYFLQNSEDSCYINTLNDYRIYRKGPEDSEIYVAKVRICKWLPIYKWYKSKETFNNISLLKNDLQESYVSYVENKKTEKEMKKLYRIE